MRDNVDDVEKIFFMAMQGDVFSETNVSTDLLVSCEAFRYYACNRSALGCTRALSVSDPCFASPST